MRTLVIGYGSIGRRHAKVIQEENGEVAVLSAQSVGLPVCFQELSQALAEWKPEAAVIANVTSLHRSTVDLLAKEGFRGRVLVEKPIFAAVGAIPSNQFESLHVAYNLRFHPVLRELKRYLAGETILSVQVYAGQFLPDWRPGTDYRQGYSAQATLGGGVLRDLSHELDYMNWLFGTTKRLVAWGGHFSSLEISTADVFALLLETTRCPAVSLQVNYLDRHKRREVVVNTERMTIKADLVAGTLQGDRETRTFAVERDATYRAQFHAWREGRWEELCSAADGLEVVRVIEMAEQSTRDRAWVCHE